MFSNEMEQKMLNIPKGKAMSDIDKKEPSEILSEMMKSVSFDSPVIGVDVYNGDQALSNPISAPLNTIAKTFASIIKDEKSKSLSPDACFALDYMFTNLTKESLDQYIREYVILNFCNMIDQIYYGEGKEFKYVFDSLSIKADLAENIRNDKTLMFIIDSYFRCSASYGNVIIIDNIPDYAGTVTFARYTAYAINNNIYRIICKTIEDCITTKYSNIYEYSRINYESMIDKIVTIIEQCTEDCSPFPNNKALAISAVSAIIKDMLLVNASRLMRFIGDNIENVLVSIYQTSYYNFGLQGEIAMKEQREKQKKDKIN